LYVTHCGVVRNAAAAAAAAARRTFIPTSRGCARSMRSSRFGRAPRVTFRQVSSSPHHPPTFSPTDRPTRSGFSPAVLGSAGDRQRNKSWLRLGGGRCSTQRGLSRVKWKVQFSSVSSRSLHVVECVCTGVISEHTGRCVASLSDATPTQASLAMLACQPPSGALSARSRSLVPAEDLGEGQPLLRRQRRHACSRSKPDGTHHVLVTRQPCSRSKAWIEVHLPRSPLRANPISMQ
jgi:hypothetical protein